MKPQKPLQWHIQQDQNENLMVNLSGDLTRNTLLPLWKQRASFLSPQANQKIVWDLAELNTIDSAGLTLLLELLNCYKDYPNSIINAPEFVTDLANLFDLEDWLAKYLA